MRKKNERNRPHENYWRLRRPLYRAGPAGKVRFGVRHAPSAAETPSPLPNSPRGPKPPSPLFARRQRLCKNMTGWARAQNRPSAQMTELGGVKNISTLDCPATPSWPIWRRSSDRPAKCMPAHNRSASKASRFDLGLTPWAPTRLTSFIFHPGPATASGASTLEPGPTQLPCASNFLPNRAARHGVWVWQ